MDFEQHNAFAISSYEIFSILSFFAFSSTLFLSMVDCENVLLQKILHTRALHLLFRQSAGILPVSGLQSLREQSLSLYDINS